MNQNYESTKKKMRKQFKRNFFRQDPKCTRQQKQK